MINNRQIGKLRIGSWNTGGLKTNANNMGIILEEENLDIFALQETKITAETYQLRWPGYTVHRTDYTNQSGGTAILVKRGIEHYLLPTPYGLSSMEATITVVKTTFGEIRVVSVYLRPQDQLEENDIEMLLPPGQQGIIIGDLNSKSPRWNSRLRNANGKRLEIYLDRNVDTHAVGPPRPTHYPPNGYIPDVLDIAIIQDINVPFEITNAEGGGSHEPILLSVGEGEEAQPRTTQKTNWQKFRRTAGELIGPVMQINSVEELNTRLQKFEEALQEALRRSTTIKNSAKSNLNNINQRHNKNETLPGALEESGYHNDKKT